MITIPSEDWTNIFSTELPNLDDLIPVWESAHARELEHNTLLYYYHPETSLFFSISYTIGKKYSSRTTYRATKDAWYNL